MASRAGLPPRTAFLEHVVDPTRRLASSQVIASAGNRRIYQSDDLGVSWQERALDDPGMWIVKCHTLRNGNRVARSRDDARTFLLDENWQVLTSSLTSMHHWHSPWSIDEGLTGAVLYGEYVARADVIRVWRSVDGGRSWDVVLVMPGDDGDSGRDAIRHFHTCQADPVRPGRWIVSSGDRARHCRVWITENDGDSWQEIQLQSVGGIDISASNAPRLLRHTAEIWKDGKLYWPTDDLLGRGRAAMVCFDPAQARIDVLSDLGPNEMRGLIDMCDGRWVAISEAKLSPTAAEVFLLDDAGGVREVYSIPNGTGGKTSFTRSVCSRLGVDGKFFSYDDGGVVADTCRMIEWCL